MEREVEVSAAIQELEEFGEGYSFVARILQLSSRGADGDTLSVQILNRMLERCETIENWNKNNRWCSLSMKALARTRSPESLKTILGFVRKLPPQVPFGIIDLLGSILPVYNRIIVAKAREMAEDSESETQRAIGIQTLCNMYLEGLLPGDQARHLESLIDAFKKDRYSTEHLTEMVRLAMDNRKDVWNLDDLLGIETDEEQSSTDEILGSIAKELDDL